VQPGFGPPGREFVKAAALAACEHERERFSGQAAYVTGIDGNIALWHAAFLFILCAE
jgi:hypothetical protein